ncbi:MAG: NAD(P)-dependent oxidoreductase [Acetatifactor sp.]|nr:NAD(P)-dependent oxidoreductase [Acetatifactor sp.]
MKTFLITGATGYIGGMIINRILKKDREARIIAVVRDTESAKKILPEDVRLIEADLSLENDLWEKTGCPADYIFHCAATTSSKEMINNPTSVYDGILTGTENILRYAVKCGSSLKRMINLSSVEVYGSVTSDKSHPLTEEKLGTIDVSKARSCYPLAKKRAEDLCKKYASEKSIPVLTARLAQTFGRGVKETDNRVFMQFARAAVSGEDIVLKTKGRSIGNYCGIDDCLDALLLLAGIEEEYKRNYSFTNGDIYNVVNEQNSMSIFDMAVLVRDKIAPLYGHHIKVRIEEADPEKTGYAPDSCLYMSAQKLRNCEWEPMQSLEKMYIDACKEIEKMM